MSELGDWDSGRFWRILESGLFCLPRPAHPPRRDRYYHPQEQQKKQIQDTERRGRRGKVGKALGD